MWVRRTQPSPSIFQNDSVYAMPYTGCKMLSFSPFEENPEFYCQCILIYYSSGLDWVHNLSQYPPNSFCGKNRGRQRCLTASIYILCHTFQNLHLRMRTNTVVADSFVLPCPVLHQVYKACQNASVASTISLSQLNKINRLSYVCEGEACCIKTSIWKKSISKGKTIPHSWWDFVQSSS